MPSLLEILGVLVGFLPQVFLLYLFLSIAQKSGLLSKLAQILHLPVQNILPVCLGFSCTTLAVCSLPKYGDNRRMAHFLSFIPCSAQIPLTALIIVTVLKIPLAAIIVAYLAAILLGLAVISFVKKSKDPPAPAANVKLVFPNIWLCLKDSFFQMLVFMKKISVAFILSAFVIVVLARFSFNFQSVANPSESMLFSICGVFTPVFAPVGLGHPAVICALLFGIIAKESAVSVLLFFPDVLSQMPFAAGLSLLVFYLLYPKCISCQMAVSAHCRRGVAAKILILNLLLAYACAFVVYLLCG